MQRVNGAMKINRLLEITTVLLNRKTVTATELAERFGVSTRTIYRDVDVLSGSGIPVYATPGLGGGISLLENYTLQRSMLTEAECDSMILALKTLQATRYPAVEAILEKLSQLFGAQSEDWISVDFSPWGSNPNEYNRLNDIKHAILQSKQCVFDYISSQNKKSRRRVEPLRLIFKGQSWYLWGWCLDREDFRTFRISRIKRLTVSELTFERNRPRSVKPQLTEPQAPSVPDQSQPRPLVRLLLQFKAEALFRLYDDFDDDMLIKNDDGTYLLDLTFPEDEWVYGYLQSFGPNVLVLEPPHIRELIKERARAVMMQYESR